MNLAAFASLVPAVTRLEEPALRAVVVGTWAEVLEASPYERLADVPQNPNIPGRSLLRHVNEVNALTLRLLDVALDGFGVRPDHDVTLAAAILHDVDKPLLYRWDGATFRYAEGRSAADHGELGGAVAHAQGAPDLVVELIRYHSPFRPGGPGSSAEATVLHYADLAASDLATLQWGRRPLHDRVRFVPHEAAGG